MPPASIGRVYADIAEGDTVEIESGKTIQVQDIVMKLTSSGRSHIATAKVSRCFPDVIGTLIPTEHVFYSEDTECCVGRSQIVRETVVVLPFKVEISSMGRWHAIRLNTYQAAAA